MTTITALNVRLGMDVSNFSEGANLAKGEVTKVASIMRQSVPPAEKYKQELDLLNRAFSEAGKKSKEYANAVEYLKRKHSEAAPVIRETATAVSHSGRAADNAISSIKGMAAAYVSVAAVTATLKKSISLASEVEDATIAFEVLTGSAKDGAIIFEQIRQFAAESPVTFSGATQAAKTMMSFNVAAQEVEQNLRMLSDVTGGNNERFQMMSLAFSQMSAAGRLMGQDLLQMINAGFNPLQQISKTTGETMIELKKRMEDGGISAEEVRRAFQDATAEGGMFHGMTERLSNTVSGKLNIAMSDLEKNLAEIGKEMGPLVMAILDLLKALQPVMDLLTAIMRQIALVHSLTIAVITDIVNSVKTMSIDTTASEKWYADLKARELKRVQDAKDAADGKLKEQLSAVDTVAAAERKAAQETEDARKQAIEKTLKETDELVRKAQRDKEEAEKNWQRELTDARKAAMDFFEEREKANEQRRADVARGPGAGMEAGSAEAVKFAADIVNARIAGAAVPNDPAATNRDIAAKTAELLIAQRDANAKADAQIKLAEKQLKEMEENGFRRLR